MELRAETRAIIADDIIGAIMGPNIKGCDGEPATVIKALDITPFCPGAKRLCHDAIVAYGRDQQGFLVQLRDEGPRECKTRHWHLKEIGTALPVDFCQTCQRWGIETAVLVRFIALNVPQTESRG